VQAAKEEDVEEQENNDSPELTKMEVEMAK
jgi:hypothetical protein